MKTKKTLLLACTLFVLPFIASHAFAQQSRAIPSSTVTQKVPVVGPDVYATYHSGFTMLQIIRLHTIY